MKHSTSIKDIFLNYPYKKSDSSVYVKKSDVSEDSKAISYTEFAYILHTYIQFLIEHLFEGNIFTMPHSLGTLGIYKYKPKRVITVDWNLYNKDNKYKKHENIHSDGYKVVLRWKQRYKFLKVKGVYIFRFTRSTSRKLAKYLKEDPSAIYKFQDR